MSLQEQIEAAQTLVDQIFDFFVIQPRKGRAMASEMDWHKYAVSLEMQLVNAATQNAELEQQLAQAREEAERWKDARDVAFQMSIKRQDQLAAENERLQAENDQARALLERTISEPSATIEQRYRDIRAFLAEHQK